MTSKVHVMWIMTASKLWLLIPGKRLHQTKPALAHVRCSRKSTFASFLYPKLLTYWYPSSASKIKNLIPIIVSTPPRGLNSFNQSKPNFLLRTLVLFFFLRRKRHRNPHTRLSPSKHVQYYILRTCIIFFFNDLY